MGMWEASDEALLSGFATGDPEMAVVFVRRFQSKVFGLALMITRDRSDADEVAQDAFVRAWRYAASFDPRRGSVVSWLMGITRNAAVDRVRLTSTARARAELGDPAALSEAGIGDALLDDEAVRQAERGDLLGQVARSWTTLPPEQRAALAAVTVRGLTAREYAEAAGIPLGTAKTRIRLGLRKLRQSLKVDT
jgi:RNA polymerase sigma factor (sigma-70 family)